MLESIPGNAVPISPTRYGHPDLGAHHSLLGKPQLPWLRPCLLSPAGWLCAGRDLVIFNIRQPAWDTDLKRALKWLVLGFYKNTPEPDGVSSQCGTAGCSSVLLV